MPSIEQVEEFILEHGGDVTRIEVGPAPREPNDRTALHYFAPHTIEFVARWKGRVAAIPVEVYDELVRLGAKVAR